MPRIKQREKILHQPSTQEIFHCLADMPEWPKLLMHHGSSKPYSDFLSWLIQINFKNESEERIGIKGLANEFKSEPVKITKWIHAIYEDLFELNYEQPHLFQSTGIPVSLYMSHYDDSCSFNLSLPTIPRAYETFRFFFIKAKAGTDHFWVKQVDHTVGESKTEITVWLEYGFANRYRELALDKAIFLEMMRSMDKYDKYAFQIDEKLRELPIHK